ncbi:hypothetical protein C4D60_Mb02t17300 [Musa balbisiana]|uniref:Uncharacterized protein n=1 Tax=Musa balbisiana TaxID=52838 RepID=A0A4S8IBG7_MUSBA|nr:hypothetical protein C4D60_Mb02t17300 [Musa balbisiana]
MSTSNSTQPALPTLHHLCCIPTSCNFSDLSLCPLSPKQSRRRRRRQQRGSYYSTAREFWYPPSVAGRGVEDGQVKRQIRTVTAGTLRLMVRFRRLWLMKKRLSSKPLGLPV